jgi:hypothetical protein
MCVCVQMFGLNFQKFVFSRSSKVDLSILVRILFVTVRVFFLLDSLLIKLNSSRNFIHIHLIHGHLKRSFFERILIKLRKTLITENIKINSLHFYIKLRASQQVALIQV